MHFNSNSSPGKDDLIVYLWNKRVSPSTLHFGKATPDFKSNGESLGEDILTGNFTKRKKSDLVLKARLGKRRGVLTGKTQKGPSTVSLCYLTPSPDLRTAHQFSQAGSRRLFSQSPESRPTIFLKEELLLCWQSSPLQAFLWFLSIISQSMDRSFNQCFPLAPRLLYSYFISLRTYLLGPTLMLKDLFF